MVINPTSILCVARRRPTHTTLQCSPLGSFAQPQLWSRASPLVFPHFSLEALRHRQPQLLRNPLRKLVGVLEPLLRTNRRLRFELFVQHVTHVPKEPQVGEKDPNRHTGLEYLARLG